MKDSDKYVFISLSVDNGLPDAELAKFAESNGYEWVFTVASPEMLKVAGSSVWRCCVQPSQHPALHHFSRWRGVGAFYGL
ncbi:MAG: hypothetical protein HC925_00115 [Coleofasciculaceae cyanobacterium SM2_3_26]|nr:hypothetical protein [Coleofasciculaceae cyanobacterium SM2_3_26]